MGDREVGMFRGAKIGKDIGKKCISCISWAIFPPSPKAAALFRPFRARVPATASPTSHMFDARGIERLIATPQAGGERRAVTVPDAHWPHIEVVCHTTATTHVFTLLRFPQRMSEQTGREQEEQAANARDGSTACKSS